MRTGGLPEVALTKAGQRGALNSLLLVAAAVAVALPPAAAVAQAYEVLHSFTAAEGSPTSRLIRRASGELYGTAQVGGRFGLGSVFVMRPNGIDFEISTLWEFSGADGERPVAGLVEGADGSFYGTTSQGGPSGSSGTVFRLDASGSLRRFTASRVAMARAPPLVSFKAATETFTARRRGEAERQGDDLSR